MKPSCEFLNLTQEGNCWNARGLFFDVCRKTPWCVFCGFVFCRVLWRMNLSGNQRLLWNTVGRMGGAVAVYFAAIGFLAEKLPKVER